MDYFLTMMSILIPIIVLLQIYNWISYKRKMNKIDKDIQERKKRNEGKIIIFHNKDYDKIFK